MSAPGSEAWEDRPIDRPALDRDHATAAGRVGRHALIGLVGRGIQSSRTPRMHEREGAPARPSYTYLLVDFDQLGLPDAALGAILRPRADRGFAGLNVTHPFKQAVIAAPRCACRPRPKPSARSILSFSADRVPSVTTPTAGVSPRAFANGMADVPSGASFSSAQAARARRSPMPCWNWESASSPSSILTAREAAPLCSGDGMTLPRRIRGETDACAEPSRCGRHRQRHAGRHGEISRHALPAACSHADHWVAEIVYFPAETELLREGPVARLPHIAGHRHGDLPGRARLRALHRPQAPDRRAMAGTFRGAACNARSHRGSLNE